MQRGILGGTFDPPHIAHLVAGEAAHRDLGLDEVIYIPAGSPWQKEARGVSAAKHRLAMTTLAVEGIDYFTVDDREVRREGPTYTIDTLGEFPDGDRITLILGADAALGLTGWHRSQDVLDRVDLAVLARPGVEPEAVEDAIPGPIRWLDGPLMDISATDLRERAAAGKSLRFLVPDGVRAYISANHLYQS